MDLGMDGRVALVMGASKGLGRGIAESLAREGAKVAIASRSREQLDATAEGIHGHVAAFVADAGDLDGLSRLVADVEADLGPIDILVANTGGPPKGGPLDNSIEEWEAAYRSLVLGVRVLVEAVLPGMRERGWGRIVDVGSNSIRLVVYERASRAPLPVFNEKVLCGLARGLDATGRLNPEGVEMALANIDRFTTLAHNMKVTSLDLLATAAVRDAADGEDFMRELERRPGIKAHIVSGKDEARFSGFGVICGMPDASGVMGDLGGGSLQITGLASGLDTNQIITEEMSIYQQPVTNLQNQSSGLTATNKQLTSIQQEMQTLSSDALAVGDPTLFETQQSVTSSDPTRMTATSATGARSLKVS